MSNLKKPGKRPQFKSANNTERIFLKVGDVSNYLHVHVSTVRRWAHLGILHEARIGKRGDRVFHKYVVQELQRTLSRNTGEKSIPALIEAEHIQIRTMRDLNSCGPARWPICYGYTKTQ